MQPFGKTSKDDAELQALRYLHAQVKGQPTEQSEDIKKALAIVEANTRKEDAKSYKNLVGLLEKARKKLNDIEEQWETFRGQWSNYLDSATKMWTAHIDSYEEGELKFAEKRKEAALYLQYIRTNLHEIHVKTMSSEGFVPPGELQEGQTALDATMGITEAASVVDQPQFGQLKTELTGVVQRVKNTIEEKMSKRSHKETDQGGDEVQVLEPVDKRPRDS